MWFSSEVERVVIDNYGLTFLLYIFFPPFRFIIFELIKYISIFLIKEIVFTQVLRENKFQSGFYAIY